MTDSITKILANAKRIFKTKDNNLKYIVIADDENGKETNYTLNFNYDGITVGRTVVNNNKIEVISNIYEYNKDVFLFVLKNLNALIGSIYNFNYNINLTLNTIPTMVFSNSVFKKEGIDGEEIYDGDKYIDDFIAYNNENILINNNNYFTFLKITVEAGNIEIFDYLRFTYDEYMNKLLKITVEADNIEIFNDYLRVTYDEYIKKQIAILIYTACKRNPTFITKMRELDFTFGFEVLKLAVDNNDYKVLEYLYNEGIDINTVEYRDTILDYAFEKNINIGMIKFLLDYNIKITCGCYVADYIKKNPKIIESLFKRADIIDILKLKTYYDGWSVAHVIARNKDPEVVKLLFEMENINDILKMEDKLHRSIAYVIIYNENPEVVKLLFEMENINDILMIEIEEPFSVLYAIANNKNLEIVKLLFEKENIVDILKINCYGFPTVNSIVKNKNPEVVKLLFKINKEDLNDILKLESEDYGTVLHTMAGNKNPDIVKSLLTYENIELKKEDVGLIKENFNNNEEIMNLLLTRGLISANNAAEELNIITAGETDMIPEHNTTKKAIC